MIFSDNNSLLQFESFTKYDSLTHFSTTTSGGVSSGNYATFNLGIHSGDQIECVAENRNRLADILNIAEENLITPYQTHEDKTAIIDESFLSKSDLEKSNLLHGIDALITNQRGICIGVSTADCVPILAYDPTKQVLAAIHAGWRSTVAKLPSKVISIMSEKFGCNPSDIIVGIAPSISKEYFEIGDEVLEAFDKAGFPIEDISYRNSQTGKMHIDLWMANELMLILSGVSFSNIEISGLCTYSNPELFFSARRQGIRSGRMLTGGILLQSFI